MRAAYAKFSHKVKKKGHKQAVYGLKNKYNIELEKKEYAEIFDLCKKLDETPSKFNVNSIDSVKGLEAETCLFILTPNTFKYYSQINLKEEQHFNKEWKKLYVALTRAK